MGQSTIPVDFLNPGQVFACMGFLEAAHILCGPAEGGFVWQNAHDPQGEFMLAAAGADNPVKEVLAFLVGAELQELAPRGWKIPKPKKSDANRNIVAVETFGASKADNTSLPIQLRCGDFPEVLLSHWMDGSSRNEFKLYAGNRSAFTIAQDMLMGKVKQLKKGKKVEAEGIRQLWHKDQETLVAAPFDTLTSLGGSFNFDPRGAWVALDAGYSPNDQNHDVEASPVVELMAAWGLQHTRPQDLGGRNVSYAIWQNPLPPVLARAVLGNSAAIGQIRRFQFQIALSGKNKVVTIATEESS